MNLPACMRALLASTLLSISGCMAAFPDIADAPPDDALSTLPELVDLGVPIDSAPGPVDMRLAVMDSQVDIDRPVRDAAIAVDAVAIPDEEPPSTGGGPPFHQAIFGASHNSYSGGRERGGIIEQLSAGVRLLEFDLHDNHFEREGDWLLGHAREGEDVETGRGNPLSVRLRDWLELVVAWSEDNPGHAPITLLLDIKDNLRDNEGPEEGNLGALNQAVEQVLGRRLYPSRDRGPSWPRVSMLRDRILVVLSGHQDTRRSYNLDFGYDPVVSMNRSGQVVEIHHSGLGALWYWTGQVQPDQSVQWIHHGRLDSGVEPSVLLYDDGYVVEVHKSERRSRLFCRVGRLTADYRIEWADRADDLVDGQRPSLQRRPNGEFGLIYEDDRDDQRWYALGEIDRDDLAVEWSDSVATQQLRYDNSRSGQLRVFTAQNGLGPQETLLYSYEQSGVQRIRYKQNFFIEYQPGDLDDILSYASFFAASVNLAASLEAYRDRGPVRLWGFGQQHQARMPFPNFPAADDPLSAWYDATMRARQASDWPQ